MTHPKMGLTHVEVEVANPAKPRRRVTVRCLVDSGAVYSVVPRTALRSLGIAPDRTETFTLADGSTIRRRMGGALFRLGRQLGLAPVIFGQRGDSALLGMTSLEAMGLMLDPIRRELRPMRLFLALGVPLVSGRSVKDRSEARPLAEHAYVGISGEIAGQQSSARAPYERRYPTRHTERGGNGTALGKDRSEHNWSNNDALRGCQVHQD